MGVLLGVCYRGVRYCVGVHLSWYVIEYACYWIDVLLGECATP